MYLKRLEIDGFKSFGNATIIDFLTEKGASSVVAKNGKGKKRGITAIVGPNGSGKSNVLDALRWVMGEQSMKNLRGRKAEDIIFAGTDAKGRCSTARVAMVLDNKDRAIPLEYDEVTIERRVHRDGDGEYYINGARVRMIDIIDALAEAGVGKDSYSVISQGMTDAILSAGPVERRAMIEDAAGVKHFQIRKERALKKLDRTKENLVRVRELIAEVAPRVQLLKRQAEKAQQGKQVYEALRTLQRQYFAFMWHTLDQERTALEGKRTEAKDRVDALQKDVDACTTKIHEASKTAGDASQITAFEKEKNDAYAALRALDEQIAVARGKQEVLRGRRTQEQETKSVPVDVAYVQAQLGSVQKEYDHLIVQLELVKDLAEIEGIRKRARDVRELIEKLYADTEKTEIAVPADDRDAKIAALDKKIAAEDKAIASYEKESTTHKEAIIAIDEKIAATVTADQKNREEFFALEKEARAKQQELDQARAVYNELQVSFARVDVRSEDLATEAQQDIGVAIATLAHDGTELDAAKTEREIQKLRGQYEHIGAIDPLVIDEYQETQERYDFLSQEVDDLEQAIEKLKDVVKEMDTKIQKAFVKAYKHINEDFTKYFQILFGGGRAKLKKVMIDKTPKTTKTEDDTEDSADDGAQPEKKEEVGIEIVASPPGKKVQHLSLLSGGERSLTSTALLFAIISYNPPPFAILDEVEAALDEANSRRLAQIFGDLGSQTQFIIITHNRETMRHADALYGVTMGRDGASQIVSVRLDKIGEKEA